MHVNVNKEEWFEVLNRYVHALKSLAPIHLAGVRPRAQLMHFLPGQLLRHPKQIAMATFTHASS